MTDARVELLLAKQEITEVLYRYARGCDRRDEAALLSCFHADSQHEHGAFKGTSRDFIAFLMKYEESVSRSAHMITNMLIEVKGDRAVSEAHFLAHARLTDPATGEERNRFSKGRYLDRLEKRDGAWRIYHRTGITELDRYMGALDLKATGLEPGQKPHDPLYALLASL